MNYREWSESYLLYYVQPTSKSRTYEQYAYLIQKHILPYIGEKELCDITALELQRVISQLLRAGNLISGKGLASSTVNTIVTVLRGSFREARAAGEIAVDPSTELRRPSVRQKQIESFSDEEQKRIEYTALRSKPKMLGVILCLYTGMRIGELLALEWDDIDFYKNLINIRKTCRDGKHGEGRITDTPKTVKSRRSIPLSEPMLKMLYYAKQRSVSRYVISEKGAPVSIRSYQRSFQLLLKRANVPHKGFHALRHTFATRAAECGMDAKTIAEVLGHKNPTVTLNLYVHSMAAHKADMMNRVGMLISFEPKVLEG